MDASVAAMGDHKHLVSLLVSKKEADTAPERGHNWAPGWGTWNEAHHSELNIPSLKPQRGALKTEDSAETC